MGKYGVWIVLISLVKIKGAFSEECPVNKPGNSVSFCTDFDQNGTDFILGTWDTPRDTRWNCQCYIFTNQPWTGSYLYRPDNMGPCSITLSISIGYINNNCTSQMLSHSLRSNSLRLTKNTTHSGVGICFVIKGSGQLRVKCMTHNNQVPTSTPDDGSTGTTFGHQSTTQDNQAMTSSVNPNPQDGSFDNDSENASITAAAVGSAVVVICIVIIIVVVCYLRRRLAKMQQGVQSITLSCQYENSAAMNEDVMSRNNQIPQNSQSFMTNSSIGRTDDVTNQQSSSYDYIDDSVVNHSRAFSEECPRDRPGNSGSFCNTIDQNETEFILGTWGAPKDTKWNCRCHIYANPPWTGHYVYSPDNVGSCSITLSTSDGYINNNCTSQTLSQSFGSQSVTLTKNTKQNGLRICFVINGTGKLNVKCEIHDDSIPPATDGISTDGTIGHQSKTPNKPGTTSKNEQTTPPLHNLDTHFKNKEDNTAAIAGGVVAAVVVIVAVIVIVICIIRRRKSRQAEDPKTEETVQKDPDYDETVMTENVMYHVGMNAVPAGAQMASPGNEYSQVHKPNAKMGTEENTKYVYSQVQKPSKNKSDSSEEPHSPDVLLKEGYSEVFDSSDDAGYHVYRQPDSPTNSYPQVGKGEATPAGVSRYDYIDESKMLSDGTLQKRKVSDASSQHYDYVSTSALGK